MRILRAELDGKKVQLACAHWRSFPPLAPGRKKSSDELRSEGIIDDAEYQRFQIWEKICGLITMDPDKCLKCPHVRKAMFHKQLPSLVSLDGKIVTPTLDLPSLESSARHRKFLEMITPPGGGR